MHGITVGNARIRVTDVAGKLIYIREMMNNEVEIDMRIPTQGIYLVQYSDDRHTQTIRVSKK